MTSTPSREEKTSTYMKLTKRELVEMLIALNEVLEGINKPIAQYIMLDDLYEKQMKDRKKTKTHG